ncbi:MAG TPA: type II toxin-antitoxin system HipA family toxin [Sphaerochaeta sp.]|nr:type II toxin-antitoxin system HipA family toxin [Sphaerochaeta sp.]
MNNALDVWMNGELVGRWRQEPRNNNLFMYSDSWLASPSVRPLSLSLPLSPSAKPLQGQHIEDFFDNLLPDNSDIRQRIQRRFGCRTTSAFDLLGEIGKDCVGALQLLPEGSVPPDIHTIEAQRLKTRDVATLIRSIKAGSIPEDSHEEPFRISLAGAQEKTALLFHEGFWCRPIGSTPTTHIFKLPLGKIGTMQADMGGSIENEWLCLNLLEAFGMDVAKTDIATFEDQKVLVVERFDRRLSSGRTWWMRLPQEDLCQATGTQASMKYESEGGPGISSLMKLLLHAADPQANRKKFLKAQILFWLLAAPDGHAKNFSIFLERQGRYTLTPLYDVVSAYPVLGHGVGMIPKQKLKMAMATTGTNRHYEWARITKRHWIEQAKTVGSATLADDIISEIVQSLPTVIDQVTAKLPQGFPEEMAAPIMQGIQEATKKLQL